MDERALKDDKRVVRHSMVELAEHWAVALSGLVLVVSGFFQMPTANRYYFTSLPGLSWSGDFFVSLNVHYAASVVFIAAALFHIVYHGMAGDRGMIPRRGDLRTSITVIRSFFGKGKEPPFQKYLPEQRLAYVGMAFIIALLVLSGLIKTYKNIYAPDMSLTVVLAATWAHNVAFVLFVLAFLAHMAAIALKPNRPMIRGIFTGSVGYGYVKHRHPLWLEEMEPIAAPEGPAEQTPLPEVPEAGLEVEAEASSDSVKTAADENGSQDRKV